MFEADFPCRRGGKEHIVRWIADEISGELGKLMVRRSQPEKSASIENDLHGWSDCLGIGGFASERLEQLFRQRLPERFR